MAHRPGKPCVLIVEFPIVSALGRNDVAGTEDDPALRWHDAHDILHRQRMCPPESTRPDVKPGRPSAVSSELDMVDDPQRPVGGHRKEALTPAQNRLKFVR
jgi:hypothetical protein